jgi:hypothetical protein
MKNANPNVKVQNQCPMSKFKLKNWFLHLDCYMFDSENFLLTFCPLTPSLSPEGRGEG